MRQGNVGAGIGVAVGGTGVGVAVGGFGVGVAVGGTGVGVAVGGFGVGVAVGGTGVVVGGTGVAAGAPHPIKSNKTNVIPIICCGNFWGLIFVLLSSRQRAAQRPRAQLPGGSGLSRTTLRQLAGQESSHLPHASRVSCSELLGGRGGGY